MKKIERILSIFAFVVAVIVAVNFAPTEAKAADTHTHCVCGGTLTADAIAASNHSCSSVTWKAWTNTTSLPANSLTGDQYYYLENDVQISSAWTPKKNTATADYNLNLHICFNGHRITMKDGTSNATRMVLSYQSGGTTNLSFCDCKANDPATLNRGGIFGSNYNEADPANMTGRKQITAQGALICMLGGNLELYGGVLAGGFATQNGGCVVISGSKGFRNGVEQNYYSNFDMYGGTIKDGYVKGTSTDHGHGGNLVIGGSSVFNMYGGTISGGRTAQASDTGDKKYGGNIYTEGVTNILGGTISGGTAGLRGGNIYAGSTSKKVTIKNATITGGTALGTGSNDGGGNVYLLGPVDFEDSVISDGIATYKGGNVFVGQNDTAYFHMLSGLITRGFAEKNTGGNVANNACFVMEDGEVSYGTATGGGNIWVNIGGKAASETTTRGRLTMNGGVIKDGILRSSSGVYGSGNGCNISLNGGLVSSSWYYPGQFYLNGGQVLLSGESFTGKDGKTYTYGSSTGNGANIYMGGYMKMTGGTVSGGKSDASGGAIYIKGGSQPTDLNKQVQMVITGGTVQNGYSKSTGGNIQLASYSKLTISGGVFKNATCDSYGANVSASSNSELIISGGTFLEGVRTSGDKSTQNVWANGKVTISGGVFARTGSNNGIYLDTSTKNTSTITGGYIERIYVAATGTDTNALAYKDTDSVVHYTGFISGGYFDSIGNDNYIVPGYSKVTLNPAVTADADGTTKSFRYEIGQFATVAATSKVVGSDNKVVSDMTLANITGGDRYKLSETVTLRTTAATGYRFLGWFKLVDSGDYSAATAKSTDYSYSFTAEEDITLVALYTKDDNAGLSLTVTSTGDKFTVTIDGVTSAPTDFFTGVYPFNTKVGISYAEAEHPFAAWANSSGKYMSREAAFEFNLGMATELETVTDWEAVTTIAFVSDSGQLVKTVSKTSVTDTDIAKPTVRTGRAFKNFTIKDEDGTYTTAAECATAINTLLGGDVHYVEVVLHYEANGDIKKLTINCVTTDKIDPETLTVTDLAAVTGEKDEFEVKAGSYKQVKARASVSGGTNYKYLATVVVRDKVVEALSYDETFTITITEDADIYAVYTSSTETITKKGGIAITAMTTTAQDDGRYTLSIGTSRKVPDEFVLLEQGILFTTDKAGYTSPKEAYGDLSVDSEAIRAKKVNIMKASDLSNEGTFFMNAKNASADNTIYARGYVIYSYTEGGETKKGVAYSGLGYGNATAGLRLYVAEGYCECGGTLEDGTEFADGTTHVCTNEAFEPWSSTNSLPTTAGCYILQKDVALTAAQTISGTNQKVVLMLNGKKVTTTAVNVYVLAGTGNSLVISDLAGQKGSITGYSSTTATTTAGAIVNETGTGASLTIYNGTLNAGADMKTRNYGGLIAMGKTNSHFTMYGGRIAGGKIYNNTASPYYNGGGNVYIAGSTSTFKMYGGEIAEGKALNEAGYDTWMAGGNVFTSSAVVTICGGTISGGYAKNGGNMICSGPVTMYGGTITNGTSLAEGGNVELDVSGSLDMLGGTITVGSAGTKGGNLYVQSKAKTTTITGGTISKGTATDGGNIYVKGYTEGVNFNIDNSGDTYLSLSGGTARNDGGNLYLEANVTAELKSLRSTTGVAKNRGGALYSAANLTMSYSGTNAKGTLTDGETSAACYFAAPVTFDFADGTAFASSSGIGVTGPVGRFSATPVPAEISDKFIKYFSADDETRPVYYDSQNYLCFGGTPITDVNLSTDKMTITGIDSTKTLTAETVVPTGTYNASSVTWTSGAPGVATVTKDANDPLKATVKAVSEGTATITFKVSNGTTTFTKTCSVTVVTTHSHALGTNSAILAGEGTAKTWTAWTSATTLPTAAGSYYLTKDVTLSAAQSIGSGKNVELCLNGYTVKGAMSRQIYSVSGGGITICDCSEGEKGQLVATGTTYRGNCVFTSGTSTVTVYGGTLHGSCANGLTGENSTSGNGGGGTIFISTNSVLNIHGGTITDGFTIDGGHAAHGGNICCMGEFHMDGGIIENGRSNYKGGNISFLEQKANVHSTITGGIIRNGVVFSNDTSDTYGGNICVNPGTSYAATHSLTIGGDVVIEGGSAMENIYSSIATHGAHQGYGGNIAILTGHVTIEGNTVIEKGNAAVYGGNLYAKSTSSTTRSSLTVTGNTLVSGGYAWMGGGIAIFSYDDFTLSGNVLVTENNCSTGSSVSGAGIYFANSTATMKVTGSPQVKGNLSNDSILSNIYVVETSGIADKITLTGLTGDASLGFYSGKLNVIHDYDFASSASDLSAYLHSDDPAYEIEYKSGKYSIKGSTLKVGFGRENIDPIDAVTGGVIPVPLAGYGNTFRRTAQSLDPNGALTTTAIAVAAPDGVAIFIATDTIRSNATICDTVRKQISAETGVNPTNILFTASHSHSTPDISTDAPSVTDANYTLKKAAYDANQQYLNEIYIPGMVKAAKTAMSDLAPVTEAKIGKGNVEGMNFVRHYTMKGTDYIAGDNFNGFKEKTSGNVFGLTSYLGHVTEVDDTLMLYTFVRDGKAPVVMMNWHAHPTITGSYSRRVVSSDYVGRVRKLFEEETGALFAFFQGAAGNNNSGSRISSEEAATGTKAPTNSSDSPYANSYGRLMTDAMKEVYANSVKATGVNASSSLKVNKLTYSGYRKNTDYYSDATKNNSQVIANYWSNDYTGTSYTSDATMSAMILATYCEEKNESYNDNATLVEKYGHIYWTDDGRYYSASGTRASTKSLGVAEGVIHSPYDSTSIKGKSNLTSTKYTMPLYVISIGSLAITEAPYEMYDTDAVIIRETGEAMGYEECMVVAYSNQSTSYMPSKAGFTQGAEPLFGSYESDQCYYAAVQYYVETAGFSYGSNAKKWYAKNADGSVYYQKKDEPVPASVHFEDEDGNVYTGSNSSMTAMFVGEAIANVFCDMLRSNLK